jgi:uncharacterized membrane protein SpoIIM required for sporulation
MNDQYDLYGPIWVMITLIVFSCIFGYFSHHISAFFVESTSDDSSVEYSIERVASASFLMICYFFLNPLVLYGLANYVLLIPNVKYLYLFTVYGYSFSSFILMSVLYIVPQSFTHILTVFYAGTISLTFIFKELRQLIEERMRQDKQKFAGIAAYLVLSHLYFIYQLTSLYS